MRIVHVQPALEDSEAHGGPGAFCTWGWLTLRPSPWQAGGLWVGAQLHLSQRCFSFSRACCTWSRPLMPGSSIWNCVFFLLSSFRKDVFSSGMPNTNPHFISRALFPSTPPWAGYLQTCHPTTRVNLPVKWKEGKAPSQRIWADEPYITRAKNMQLIGMEKRKLSCA